MRTQKARIRRRCSKKVLTFAKGCPDEREKGKYREIHRIADEAEGDTVKIIVKDDTRLTAAQQTAERVLGRNSKLFEVAVKIDNQPLRDFKGGKIQVRLPIPTHLKDKDILLLDIDEKGFWHVREHRIETVGADSYISFIVQ